MPVSSSRVPGGRLDDSHVAGAENWLALRSAPRVSLPVAYPAEGSPGPPQGAPGTVSTLPQAGSPLMAALVKYVQSRNPAVAVNEGNVGGYLAGVFDQPRRGLRGGLGGYPWSVPGPGRNLVRALIQAGLMRPPQAASVSPAWFSGSPGLRAMAVARNNLRHTLGLPYVQPYVDRFAHLAMWQPSAPAQVPVATLPEQVPVATLPEPFAANTPVGPMLYPPGPAPFGSQDPRR